MDERSVLAQSEAMYRQLVEVYPNDPRFLREYARILDKLGKQAQARRAWERLYGLLLAGGNTEEAEALARDMPWLAGKGPADALPSEAPFLDFLDLGLMERLLLGIRPKKLADGEHLFRLGDPPDAIYLVLEGELVALVPDPDTGRPVTLNHLRKGDVVGEWGVLTDRPRSASVVAAAPSSLLEIPRRRLRDCLARFDGLEQHLKRTAAERRKVTLISRNRLLRRLPLAERKRLASRARVIRVTRGRRVCEGGRLITEVLLITRGTADLVYTDRRGQEHVLHDLEAGDMLGDEAILGEARHPADIVAATHLELLTLDLDTLRDQAAAYPVFRKQIEDLMATTTTRVMQRIERIRKVRELD